MRIRKKKHPSGTPFVGYRVTLARNDAQRTLLAIVSSAGAHEALHSLVSADRPVILSAGAAAALYDTVERLCCRLRLAFPLRLMPIRCRRGRALPFESVALSSVEILHLVHDGYFGTARGRDAAIAAVEACGALPVPALALRPVWRGAPRLAVERHVDTLIDREAELQINPSTRGRGPVE